MSKDLVRQINSQEYIVPCLKWVESMIRKALQAGPVVIKLGRPTRTLEQNNLMWEVLTALSVQIKWYDEDLSPTDWKNMITAVLKGQKTVPGLEGGFVVIGASTSKMTIAEMSDVIEYSYMLGSKYDVKFKSHRSDA